MDEYCQITEKGTSTSTPLLGGLSNIVDYGPREKECRSSDRNR